MGTIADLLNTAMRDFQRYTGDGLPGEPVGRPLPVGDPASGQFNPPKKQVRDAFLAIAGAADNLTEAVQSAANSAELSGERAATSTVQAGISTTQAGVATTAASQATVAAITAGAKLVTSLTNPVPDNNSIELLQTGAGTQIHEVQAGAWVQIGWLGVPIFPTIAAMAAASGYINGQSIYVEQGSFGRKERFVAKLEGEESAIDADGVLVVAATGMGAGRLVSKRTEFADWAEFKADVRAHTSGASVSLQNGNDTYKAVASGGHTGLTNAGGQQFVATSTIVTVQTFGADPTGVADATDNFKNALAAFGLVYIPDGEYRIDAAAGVTIPIGGTLYSHNQASIYYADLPAKIGVKLFKDSDSEDGPIINRSMSSGLHGVQIEHLKVGGLQDGVMRYAGDVLLTNCTSSHVYIIGVRTPSVDLDPETGNAGFGIKFEHCPTTSTPSFFNVHNEIFVTECDVGIRLGQLCNGNRFTGYNMRNCHVEIDIFGNDTSLPGGNLSIENSFTAGGHFAIGVITPRPVAFRLKYARQNVFMGYAYESYGKEFEVDEATCEGNIFGGAANSALPSALGGQSNINLRHQQVDNFKMKTRMPLITSPTADDRNIFTGGGTFRQIFQVQGTMPLQGNNAGTLIAGNASNKTILRLPANFTKARKCSFIGKFKVFGYGPFGNGTGAVEVEFGYSMRNQSTSEGEFKVFTVKQMGNEITGLHFLTGVVASLPMGIALVGGNYGGFAFSWLRCELELFVTDILSTEDTFTDYLDLTSTTTADVTEDDVDDGITMLTVGATTV